MNICTSHVRLNYRRTEYFEYKSILDRLLVSIEFENHQIKRTETIVFLPIKYNGIVIE